MNPLDHKAPPLPPEFAAAGPYNLVNYAEVGRPEMFVEDAAGVIWVSI